MTYDMLYCSCCGGDQDLGWVTGVVLCVACREDDHAVQMIDDSDVDVPLGTLGPVDCE